MDLHLIDFRLPNVSYAYKPYGFCDRCDRDLMLKTSGAVNDVKA